MDKKNKKSRNIEEHLVSDFPFIGPPTSTNLNFDFKDKSHTETETEAMRKQAEEGKEKYRGK